MKFAVFCFIILQQLTFKIIEAQQVSSIFPYKLTDLPEEKFNSYSSHQYDNVSPTNNKNTILVADKEVNPYRKKNDYYNPNSNTIERKYSYHVSNSWNQNDPQNNVNQIPYLTYYSKSQHSKYPLQNNNYLPEIITKAGNAVKETSDENHDVFKNSIDSLVAAGVANTNAGRDLVQSSLAFGTSFPRFGAKLFGQSDVTRQKNGFNIGRFPF